MYIYCVERDPHPWYNCCLKFHWFFVYLQWEMKMRWWLYCFYFAYYFRSRGNSLCSRESGPSKLYGNFSEYHQHLIYKEVVSYSGNVVNSTTKNLSSPFFAWILRFTLMFFRLIRQDEKMYLTKRVILLIINHWKTELNHKYVILFSKDP